MQLGARNCIKIGVMKPRCGVDWNDEVKGKGKANNTLFFTLETRSGHVLTFDSYQANILIYLCENAGRAVRVGEIITGTGLSHQSKVVSQEIPKIIKKLAGVTGTRYEPLAKEDVKVELEPKKTPLGKWCVPTADARGEFVFEYSRGKVCVCCREIDLAEEALATLQIALKGPLESHVDECFAKTLGELDPHKVYSLASQAQSAVQENGDFDENTVRRVLENHNAASAAVLHKIWERCRALHQLPTLVNDFVGRAGELAQLRACQPAQGALLVGLRGMGGIGKTTLAFAIANQWKPRFPDAQLVLGGYRSPGEPFSPAQLLATAIFAFRPEQRLLLDESTIENRRTELEGIYRDLLSGQNALILVDNAHDADQIKALIPPPGCALIVTSRRGFMVGSSAPYIVGGLKNEDAAQFLQGVNVSLNQAEIKSLVQLCSGLPLALRIVRAHLTLDFSERDGVVDVGAYIQRLKAGRLSTLDAGAPEAGEDPVSVTLQASENGLAQAQRDAWRRLSIFPADFDAAAASAVSGVQVETFDALVRRSLLERKNSRYNFHDLVREFALARLEENPAQHHEAGFQHAQHFLAVLQETKRLHLEGGAALVSGLALFDREWSNIEAGQKWARDHANSSEATARLCIEYSQFAFVSLNLRQHPRVQIRWSNNALSAFESVKQPTASEMKQKSLLLHNLGLAHSNLGEMTEAVKCYEQALCLMIELNNKFHQATCLGNCGWAYYRLGQTEKALSFYNKGLEVTREVVDQREQNQAKASLLTNLGIACKDAEKFDQALNHYNDALKLARQNQDQRQEGNLLGGIGVIHDLNSDYVQAICHFKQQHEVCKTLGDKRGQASALFNNAISTNKSGNTKRSIKLGEQSLALFKLLSDPMVLEVEKTVKEWRMKLETA